MAFEKSHFSTEFASNDGVLFLDSLSRNRQFILNWLDLSFRRRFDENKSRCLLIVRCFLGCFFLCLRKSEIPSASSFANQQKYSFIHNYPIAFISELLALRQNTENYKSRLKYAASFTEHGPFCFLGKRLIYNRLISRSTV